MKVLILSAMALAVCSAASAQPAQPARQCISTREIDNTTVVDDSTVHFRVGRQIYEMKMAGPCPRLKDNIGGFVMRLRGSDQICSPLDLQISVNDNVGGFCNASTLRALSPEELAALPKK